MIPPVPQPPPFMSYIESRRQQYKLHNTVGHAINSIIGNARVYDYGYELSYRDEGYDWDRQFMFNSDCSISEWNGGEWIVVHEVTEGQSYADRPWK